MPCEISAGRDVSCKDAVGGIKGVYFLNYTDGWWDTAVFTSNEINKFATGSDAGYVVYYYQVRREMCNLEVSVNSSPENGTTFFEQSVSLQFNKLTQADADAMKLLAYGRPHIILEDNQGNLIMCGGKNGMDVTGGTMTTGQAFGDRNGFTLNFTGREVEPFYTLVGDSVTGTAAAAPFENFAAADIDIYVPTP